MMMVEDLRSRCLVVHSGWNERLQFIRKSAIRVEIIVVTNFRLG